MSGKKSSKRIWLQYAGFAAASFMTAALVGCSGDGFKPMHAHSSVAGSNSIAEKLRAVEITTIPGRVGQRIRNELIFQSSGGGERAAPKYRLDITITEKLTSTLVNADGEPANKIYILDAKFALLSLTEKKIIATGKSHGRAAYERFSSIFSNVRAREDAENRAAKTVAQDIKNQLAAVLVTS